jgi:hypothetical protein
MDVAEPLKKAAIATFDKMRERKTNLQSEYDDLQSKLAYKKADLDAQIDVVGSAYERMLNFKPLRGEKALCPRCWVVNSKESAVSALNSGNALRCKVCHQELSIL